MKTLPILFSPPMVAALLAGRKTQTRRLIAQPKSLAHLIWPDEWSPHLCPIACPYGQPGDKAWTTFRQASPPGPGMYWLRWTNGAEQLVFLSRVPDEPQDAPAKQDVERWLWGKSETDDPEALTVEEPGGALDVGWRRPGDMLWVREEHYRLGHWEPVQGKKTKGGKQKWAFVADSDKVSFEPTADMGTVRKARRKSDPATPAWHKRLARFIPRTLSRLTLEVTEVRVECGKEMSEADAIAEGVEAAPFCKAGRPAGMEHGEAFEDLFDHINGPGSMKRWRWAISFKVLP
jgi:hypothetical protein